MNKAFIKLLLVLQMLSGLACAQSAQLTVSSALLSPAGGTVSVTASISFSGSPSALGWTVNLPPGWSYAGGSSEPGVAPVRGQTGTLEWAFTSVPVSPAIFSFVLSYPAGVTGAQSLGGSALYREGGQLRSLAVSSLTLTPQATSAGGALNIINASTRVQVGAGASVLITGLVFKGDGSKRYLVRAAGPALGAFGVPDTLADPVLSVIDARGVVVASNDNWDPSLTATFSGAGAFPFPVGSKDAALAVTLRAGSYTFQVSGAGGTSGIAMVEVYDLDP